MPAHQCPRCPLLFSFRTELEAHLDSDHRPREDDAATDAAPTRVSSDSESAANKAPAPA
jgi:hypothetical protein